MPFPSAGRAAVDPIASSKPKTTLPTPAEVEAQRLADVQNRQGMQSVQDAASSGAGYSTSYQNTATGQNFSYSPGGGGGARGGAGGGGSFDALMAKYGGSAGGKVAPVRRATLDRGAIAAGDAAAYSQAKDQVGDSTGGLMKALGSQFAGRGLRGSSIEGRAIGSGLEAGMGELADVSRGQAIEGSRRSTQLGLANYEGDISQRGQDITQRGQDMDDRHRRLASVLGLFQASGQRF